MQPDQGGAYFIEREFNGILIFIYIFQVFVNQYKRYYIYIYKVNEYNNEK